MINYNCIVVLGPTASGKTRLACQLAYFLNGEIISADSRQVYKRLNIGTGKDLDEYEVNKKPLQHYLIDVIEPQAQFYLHDFTRECEKAFHLISSKGKIPVICGGTGLYLDSLRKDFAYTQIGEDHRLRNELNELSKEELLKKLDEFPAEIIKHADRNSKKRIIRAIEVAGYLKENPEKIIHEDKPYRPYFIGLDVPIDERKKLISERLKQRLNNGLISEVEDLLKSGISHERLQAFGLEYKFVSLYLQGIISREKMAAQLQTAIFQFAKRQMTWFRKMEKEGVKIQWVSRDTNAELLAKQLKTVLKYERDNF